VHCATSAWSAFTACTKTCGGGTKSRSRSITTDPLHGGYVCPFLSETNTCNTDPCAVDCVVSAWTAFGTCSKSCGGGTQSRTKDITTAPSFGGAACSAQFESRACNTHGCPDNCAVSEWGGGRRLTSTKKAATGTSDSTGTRSFGLCSKTCGGGVQRRVRSITVVPKNGGDVCPALEETEGCNNGPCPVDCMQATWTDWSSCNRNCGGGLETRTRLTTTQPVYGGMSCGIGIEHRDCATHACPIHCSYEWLEWTACTATCGGGIQRRPINVLVSAAFSGDACPDEQQRTCQTLPCPVDSVVGTWDSWSSCSTTCGTGTQSRSRVIVIAAAYGGVAAPHLSETQPCNMGFCAVDCVMSLFTPWGACTKSCGGGQRTKTRSVLVPPAHQGAVCPGTSETEACNVSPCPVDCILSQWGSWTGCSQECGGGVSRRYRVTVVAADQGGVPCDEKEQAQNCNTHGCPVHCQFEWEPWSDCSKTCGTGVQSRRIVATQQPANGGEDCPVAQQQLCNTFVCLFTGAPTPAPTPAPTLPPTMPTPPPPPPPSAQPILTLEGMDTVTIEATPDMKLAYHDEGARCADHDGTDISLRVSVSGDVGFPNVGTCSEYALEYHCVDAKGTAGVPLTRAVRVVDRTCPTCTVHTGPTQIEASFPYTDPGATCTDTLDGACGAGKKCTTTISSDVDTSKVGTYTVTYRAKDSAGNWNDENCIGNAEYKRTVTVIDTLKPVIALHYGSTLVHKGKATDYAIHNGASNPVNSWFGGTETLMAEDAGASASGGSVSAWLLAGAASVVAGVALLALARRGQAAARPYLPL